MAGPALTDVPDRYDVVFSLNDGTTYGFLFADSVESNLPFRTHKALYSYSPTFLERQNVSQQYGDNFQDFFLTGTQADFSEGEDQKFFRVNDADSVRKYWKGSNVDPLTVPGNVTLTPALLSATVSSTVSSVCAEPIPNPGSVSEAWYAADATNLFKITNSGTVTTIGAHGLGAAPTTIVADYSSVYLSTNNGSGVGIRKFTQPSSFATWSTSRMQWLVFLNNILYGYDQANDALISFDSAGTPTTQFQWKGGDGTVSNTGNTIRMVPYGGSIYILRNGPGCVELWLYDGNGCQMVGNFTPEFFATEMCVSNGIVFIAGTVQETSSKYSSVVYYYASGSIGKLWQTTSVLGPLGAGGSAAGTPMCPYRGGVVFQDTLNNNILQYDPAVGGVHSITNVGSVAQSQTTSPNLIPSGNSAQFFILTRGSTAAKIYGLSSSYNSTGFIQTSQYDFDNTLTKVFRGIKVDADIPANTSIDISYQLDGTGGSYTSLKTGAASGTEYALPNNTTGHSISVQVALNSATGSSTPTLKHVYVRAAPTLQQFRRREFLFDLSSGERDEVGKTSRRTRDLSPYPADAITACNNLVKIATQTIPFTVADRFCTGGMTVLADLQQNQAGYDGFAIYEVRPNVFIGRINLREV